MSPEALTNGYEDRTATVVGGRGQLGSRITKQLELINFKQINTCEIGNSLGEFVPISTDIFFAVDGEQTAGMVNSHSGLFEKGQTILDGASVKDLLIETYQELDNRGISVCSTHLGAVPTQPWRGIKVWLCEVGPNSEKAKKLAVDIFLPKIPSIRMINIKEHHMVERVQSFTFLDAHGFLAGLRNYGLTLQDFFEYSTLNAELLALPMGRTSGQGTKVPSEILFNNPKKHEYISSLIKGFKELEKVLDNKDGLQELMQKNIDFHDNPPGFVNELFVKAGVIGARNANLRMHSFSFRILDDKPGKLMILLVPFYEEGANITAIDSMPASATEEELKQGVDPDKVVKFDIGIDPQTINSLKDTKIKNRLEGMGCIIENL